MTMRPPEAVTTALGLESHHSDCYSHSPPSRLLKFLGLFLLCSSAVAVSQTIVETLPGYPGPLPFKLETGYIEVNEEEGAHLFYYFIESEGDPEKDPLLIWLTGGPGCSGFSALVFELGPLNFDLEASESDPTLVLNPYSWTKVASIIFLDSPPGTGYSYATTSKGYDNSDTKVAEQVYVFLHKWLLKHPKFTKNGLYISGESYGGMWIPMVVWKILKGNEAGDSDMPSMAVALKGYIMGNPATDPTIDGNSKVPFAHRLGLISDQYYKMAKVSCKENYVYPDSTNAECLHALHKYEECTEMINLDHVLEPCYPMSSSQEESTRIIRKLKTRRGCRDLYYRFAPIWANDPIVRQVLQVRKGDFPFQEWKRCKFEIPYEYNVETALPYHHLLSLSNQGFQVLVFSGDHDMAMPYIGTRKWIRQLNLSLVDDWRPWLVENQLGGLEVGGYTERYLNTKSGYDLTFATIKGAGHTSPEYKRKESLAMFTRFVSHAAL